MTVDRNVLVKFKLFRIFVNLFELGFFEGEDT